MRTRALVDLSAIFTLILFQTVTAQEQRLQLQRSSATGVQSSVRLGASITGIADLDGDGQRDILVGDDGYIGEVGGVTAFSRQGSEIITFWPNSTVVDPTERAGSTACDIGVDSSGFVRCAVGAPGFNGVGPDSGRVAITFASAPLSPTISIQGQSAGEEFGAALATLGDLDGDGLAEFLVGAPKANIGGANAGRVSLVNGANGAILYAVNGVPGSLFGSSIAAGRDVNADGIPDFVVGAPNDSTMGTNRGRSFVMSGVNGTLLLTLNGNSNGDNFGRAVAMLRDLGSDGRAEIAVSAPGDDIGMSNNGAVTIHSGFDGAIVRTVAGEFPSDNWGQSLAAGDADHDGKDDLLVGSPFADRGVTNNGVAVLYSGDDGAIIWRAEGRRFGGEFGHAVAFLDAFGGSGLNEFAVTEWKSARSASIYSFAPLSFPRVNSVPNSVKVFEIGDIDGDGKRDVAFRESPSVPTELPVRVALMGSSTGNVVRRLSSTSFPTGSTFVPKFGASVCDVGDVNGDGVDDVFVVEELALFGVLYLFSGADGSLLASTTLMGNQSGAQSRGIGDADGDGQKEVVITGDLSGLVRSFDLPSFSLNWATDVTNQSNQVTAIDIVGDIDGDGKTDVVVGSQIDSFGGSPLPFITEGSAKVLSGSNGAIIYAYQGQSQQLFVGSAVAGLEDQNSDGVPDFAIARMPSNTMQIAIATVYSGQSGLPLFDLSPGGQPKSIADLTGDGVADIVVTDEVAMGYFDGATGASFGGQIQAPPGNLIAGQQRLLVVEDWNGDDLPELFVADSFVSGQFGAAGAFKRGENVKGSQRLDLGWNASAGTSPTDGSVEIAGGTPFSTALIMLSLRDKTTSFGPYIAYVDVLDPSFQTSPVPLDATGNAALMTDLRDPSLQNFVLHVQVIDTTPDSAGVYPISNGLILRFLP